MPPLPKQTFTTSITALNPQIQTHNVKNTFKKPQPQIQPRPDAHAVASSLLLLYVRTEFEVSYDSIKVNVTVTSEGVRISNRVCYSMMTREAGDEISRNEIVGICALDQDTLDIQSIVQRN
jgi:hypothetical protein